MTLKNFVELLRIEKLDNILVQLYRNQCEKGYITAKMYLFVYTYNGNVVSLYCRILIYKKAGV